MQTQNDEVIILVAATNKSHTPEIHYALISFNINNQNLETEKFLLLKHKNFYAPETAADSLAMRFIYSRETAYVYNEKMIFLVNMLAANDENEKIEFQAQSDRIMSASCHNNLPLFFSRLHGLVSLSSSDFDADFFNMSTSDVFSPALPGEW
jgi:nuclear pore complex protein Nup133